MNIRILSQVECRDGFCGISVAAPITNPQLWLSHLVISEHWQPQTFHVVPFKLVADASHGLIRLDCTLQLFKALPNFIKREDVRKLIPPTLPGCEEYILLAAEDLFARPQIPSGEFPVSQRAQIQSTEGTLGHLDELQVEPLTGKLTYVVLREGHLWGKKRVAIPIEDVERIQDNRIYTKLTKQELEALPQPPNDSSLLSI